MRSISLILGMTLAAIATAQQYEVISVQGLIPTSAHFNSMPQLGSYAGMDNPQGPGFQAISFHEGQLRHLPGIDGENSRQFDMNINGTVVGRSEPDNAYPTGVYWDPDGTLHHLPLLSGGTRATGFSIDDIGVIGGIADSNGRRYLYESSNGQGRAVFDPIGDMQGIGLDTPLKRNTNGIFIGHYIELVEGSSQGAFVYDPNSGLHRYGVNYFLNDINDRDQIVGARDNQGFLWTKGQETLLGSFEASKINNHGDMIGGDPNTSVLQIRVGGQVFDAESVTAGWHLIELQDIDDRGNILALGARQGSTDYQSIVLHPVPEPAAWVALTLGLGFFVRRRRNRP